MPLPSEVSTTSTDLCNHACLVTITRTPSTCRPSSIISHRPISGVAPSRKFLSASTQSAVISTIRPAFEKGKASSGLLFFPSQVHIHKDLGVDVGSTQHFPPRPHRSARISDNDMFCLYYYYRSSILGYVWRCYTNLNSRPRTLRPALLTTRRGARSCSNRRTIRTSTSSCSMRKSTGWVVLVSG